MLSTIVCKFDFMPSRELSEDGSFDGGDIVEGSHGSQTHPQRPDQRSMGLLVRNLLHWSFGNS